VLVEQFMSERPVPARPRRLADWISPTGAKKVHSLIDKVYRQENVLMAWERVKENGGSGGVDRQTVAGFEGQREQQLGRLCCAKNYVMKPISLSRFERSRFQRRASRASIARRAYRTVYDRVCQQALQQRLEPIFEPLFEPSALDSGTAYGTRRLELLREIFLTLSRHFSVDTVPRSPYYGKA
jgi:RNA-directed DNA polymerase